MVAFLRRSRFAVVVWSCLLKASALKGFSHVDECIGKANSTWESPGGVSAGARHCIRQFVQLSKAGKNAYQLIDRPDDKQVQVKPASREVPWIASFNVSQHPLPAWFSKGRLPYQGELGTAKWVTPLTYRQHLGEIRIAFIHGSASQENALGPDYAGLTAKLAARSGYPVLSFNYPSEPVAPWPQNVRNVLHFVRHILEHGPEEPGRAGSIFFFADSEGTLVAMQTALTLMDDAFLQTLGYGYNTLQNAREWLAGVILSSPVVDVTCETPSFEWNCYNESQDVGDPDTGNCTKTPTMFDKIADCRWSYLSYFFGFPGLMSAHNLAEANAEWEQRRAFFEQGAVNPLRANLTGFPPLLLIGGTRDYFYSDSVNLAHRACSAGVDVETFHAVGGFHDFIEYADGCGGSQPFEESWEAHRRIVTFMKKRASSPPGVVASNVFV